MSVVGDIVGGIFGTDDAADAAQKSADQQIALQKDIYDQQTEILSPFVDFGAGLLPQLGGAMQPIDRASTLNQYYSSPEYAMLSDQARNQQLAASEATGGLGSTATGNALSSIAPQLGQNYLNQKYAEQADLFNRLMSGVNVGLGAAGGQVSAAGQYGSQASQAIGQAGAAQSGAAMAPGQILGNLGGMALGGWLGGAF